jgi:hypothetical protein
MAPSTFESECKWHLYKDTSKFKLKDVMKLKVNSYVKLGLQFFLCDSREILTSNREAAFPHMKSVAPSI